jgi:hypothetical protein
LGDEIMPRLQGEAFVALIHFAGNNSLHSGLVLGADLKHKLIETKAALAYREHSLKTWNTNASFTAKYHCGVRYSVWQFNPSFQVCHTFFGSMLVITFDEEILRDIIARSRGVPGADRPSLAQSSAYTTTLRHVPATRHVIAYLNAGQLLGPLLAFSRQSTGLLGRLSRIEATSSSMTFTSGLIEDFGFTLYANAQTNHCRPLTEQLRVFTKPETSAYLANTADFVAIHRALLDFATQFAEMPASKNLIRFEHALAALGINLDHDVLASLGPETAFLVTWREGARFPDIALVAECRDTPPLQKKLDIALAAIKDTAYGGDDEFPWENTTHLGIRLRTVHIRSGGIAPTYFFDRQHFVLALHPDYARELLAQSHATGATLAGHPDFQRLAGRLPTNNTKFTYCDLRAVFPPLYDLWRSNLTNDLIAVNQLPPPDLLVWHLDPFVAATQTTPTNEITITCSPWGKPVTWFVGVAGAYLWAKPWLDQHLTVVSPAEPKPPR